MKLHLTAPTALAAALLIAAGCSTAPESEADQKALKANAEATLAKFKEVNPEAAEAYTESADGMAVFPNIAKGGLIVGGSRGKGVVYEGGEVIGYASVSEGSIGLQAGGQSFGQIIFFQEDALKRFKLGEFSFGGTVSAVAANADAAKKGQYKDGLAVVVLDAKGLMAEASVGGQKFNFLPADMVEGK